jgi:hypothetical protein
MSLQELRLAFLYFGAVFGIGFLLGAIRVPLLVPRLGERWAELLEMPLMLIAIHWAAGLVLRRLRGPPRAAALLRIGALGLVLLVLAGRPLAAYLASRDPVSGTVYLAMLLVFAAMPWLRAAR